MTLLRVLHGEMLKVRNTIALKMVLFSPATVVLLILFATSQGPFSTLNSNPVQNKWLVLSTLTLRVWALLMMPLFITMETALLAGLDHSDNQWKSLLARPVPRWTHYLAKQITVTAMTGCGTLLLLCGILFDGIVLSWVVPEVDFTSPFPWAVVLRDGALVFGLALLSLSIQHWVSLRWRSLPVAIGFGITATVASCFCAVAGQQNDSWPQYFPWSLPAIVAAKRPHHIEVAFLVGLGLAAAVTAAGCWNFCRRDVH